MERSRACRGLWPAPFGVSRFRAFTLIEVLVVVAIIALLVSILLPSLSRAREQARLAVCLANLKTIGTASWGYITENKEVFCWTPGVDPDNRWPSNYKTSSNTSYMPFGLAEAGTWLYGGKQGRGKGVNPLSLYTEGSPWWNVKYRALNRYLYRTQAVSRKTELPLFECPSDKGVRWNSDPSSTALEGATAYNDTGTSYQSNTSWYPYTGTTAQRGGTEGLSGQARKIRVWYLYDNIIKIMLRKNAAKFIMVEEDPANWIKAQAWDTSVLPYTYKLDSWHGKKDNHTVSFLDGRAALIHIDRRKHRDYKIVNGNWAPCNPLTEPCYNGTGEWIARQDYMQK